MSDSTKPLASPELCEWLAKWSKKETPPEIRERQAEDAIFGDTDGDDNTKSPREKVSFWKNWLKEPNGFVRDTYLAHQILAACGRAMGSEVIAYCSFVSVVHLASGAKIRFRPEGKPSVWFDGDLRGAIACAEAVKKHLENNP